MYSKNKESYKMTKKLLTIVLLLCTALSAFISCEMPANDQAPNVELGIGEDAESRGIFQISAAIEKSDVSNYIEKYMNEYMKKAPGKWSRYYILMKGQGNAGDMVSTSEAMGYGMRLALYKMNMDQSYSWFENFRYLKRMALRFTIKKKKHNMDYYAMNWYIPADFKWATVQADLDSGEKCEAGPATDGDLDIALALVQATKLIRDMKNSKDWGSSKENQMAITMYYCKKEALAYIRGIAINYYRSVKMEDGSRIRFPGIASYEWDDAKYLTRPSDWMPYHFYLLNEFYKKYGPSSSKKYYTDRLGRLRDGCLTLLKANKWGHGWVPDFVIFEDTDDDHKYTYREFTKGTGSHPEDKDLWTDLGEDVVPDYLDWNACRVPWRMAEYYQLVGNNKHQSRMRIMLDKMKKGYINNGKVQDVKVSYDDDWDSHENKFSTAFAAPAAMAFYHSRTYNSGQGMSKMLRVRDNYKFLRDQFMGHDDDEDKDGYYADSINAFCLLLMTDWIPKMDF